MTGPARRPAAETAGRRPGRHRQPGRHAGLAGTAAHPDLLTHLAAGTLPLTHEALDAWPRPRAVLYLRDLLVRLRRRCPPPTSSCASSEAWLDRRLDGLAGHPHVRLLRQFGLWHQLPRMRATGRRRAAARHRRPVRPAPVHPGRDLPDLGRRPGRAAMPPSPRPTSTPGTPATWPTSARASARSWSGQPGTATSPATSTSPASRPRPVRPSPSSAGSPCCAASPPTPPSRSGPAPPPA